MCVGMFSKMNARSLIDRRVVISPTVFAEIVLWELPAPARDSSHAYKYRLTLVVSGVCILRYDNEAGKGDHRHEGAIERLYEFAGVDQLIADFQADVRRWFDAQGDH
jgi:hypothetical protein